MAYRGRPTKLTAARLKKAKDYYKQRRDDKEMPFVEELAVEYLDVDRHTVARWANKGEDLEYLKKLEARTNKDGSPDKRAIAQAKLYRDFCSTIKKLATMQLFQLKVRGIADGRNAVAIFLMKADHSMVETNRTELTGPNGEPIQFKPVEVMNIKGRGQNED